MEKRGVLDNENQEPVPEKQAKDGGTCCGRTTCGRDPMSKMAEAAANPKPKTNEEPATK